MAASICCSLFFDPRTHHHRHHSFHHIPYFNYPQDSTFTPKPTRPFAISSNFSSPNLISPLLSTSNSSSSSSSSSTTPPLSLQNPLPTARFLANEDLEKLQFLDNYSYSQELESGSLWVSVMRQEEMDMTVRLLAESFAESMMISLGYLKLLEFFVKQYLIERRSLMPHTATLVGFYRENGDGEGELMLAGTVEVCFDRRGANDSPHTPTAPKNAPYISNMAVRQSLRRRGIGWHLLKASEELISKMSASKTVYLHCRMIDAGPYNMYTKAGYSIVKTDSILVLLTLQRRKHLMCKYLQDIESPSEVETPVDQLTL
ncbi:PREDICTED: uncharacterized protein LOC109154830 [Ipomoea nil]|uniref:uncharacterized protein LOC109154830 n=1 Tax=Ipomoea nil TaxID=35883 RepID=UPI000901255A|nr:PREDICTED: uncharacterized protein LOC109154830 [Ipomoea nil]XP_019158119.1 PREDICTED: uncharacterized protein LOC109154830 [Ipomoea nil]XP_019158120.1 PREDICTED: uncharacterized protein LOC109154830 [Ipomoea nil]